MKKNLLFAVVAGVAVMTGCSKNEVLEHTPPGGQTKMEFAPVVGKQVRASEINSGSLQVNGTSINLYGYKTAGDFDQRANGTFLPFFDGAPEALTFNGFWSTTKDYEWTALDGGHKLSIFTYFSPNDVLNTIDAPTRTEATKFKYTVPLSIEDQEDLLVATHLNMTKASTGGIIAINFKHALSQLYFRAKLTGTGYKAVVKSIKVLGATNESTFTYAVGGDKIGTWGATTGTSNYVYVDATAQSITSKDKAERIQIKDNTGSLVEGSLMLMPQSDNKGQFLFEVTYDVFSPDGATLIGSKIVKTADMATLEMGKRYVYTLVLPASENDKIAFDVAVSPWDETAVSTEREIRFDEYTLTGTDATAIADLITNYTPTVVYLQEVSITGDELAASFTIDLSALRTSAITGSKIILDCSIADLSTNDITVTVPAGWSTDNSTLSGDGKITITKD